MRRTALYSKSYRAPSVAQLGAATEAPKPPSKFKIFAQRHERPLWLASGVGAALVAFGLYAWMSPAQQKLTQRDIDSAVLHTLEKQPEPPSHAAIAYNVIAPSVVLVRRLGEDEEEDSKDGKAKDKDGKKKTPEKKSEKKPEQRAEKQPPPPPKLKDDNKGTDKDQEKGGEKDGGKGEGADGEDEGYQLQGIGTGVVFSEEGLIFTCLHVIAGAERIGVTFGDGTESEVEIVDVQPENDLAVLKPKTVPDDLKPATLRSTRGLNVGDEVVAVGFPFGIGPTATSGVISGLRREHYSEEGKRNLIDLIQFDAAANPGNSGGPLVTREGDVIGIVTSIMNPTSEGFFVGIAFAVPIENAASAAGMSPF